MNHFCAKVFKLFSYTIFQIVMVTEDELECLNIRDGKWGKAAEKLEKVAAAVEEYNKNPELKIEDLAATYGIPRRSLYYYFKKLGIIRGSEKVSETQKAVRQMELNALSTEAEKIASIAIGIGGVIARRYLPLINHLMESGRTLDMIATDVMQWFEMKIPTETRIKDLEVTIETLRRQVSEAWIIAAPNFRYMLRARLVTDFAKRILVARMNGLRIPVQSSVRALHNELAQVDKDLKPLMEKQ